MIGMLAVCAVPPAALSAVRVAILPFSVNAEENLSYLQQAIPQMLATRLESRGDISTVEKALLLQHTARLGEKKIEEGTAKRIGAELGADFVVMGSLSKIGSQVTIDATLINTRDQVPVQRLASTTEELSGIPAKVKELANSLYYRILGKQAVTKITITGNKYIEQDAIMLSILTKPGDMYSPEQLQEDLKRIYKLGYFEDVTVSSADSDEEKR